MVVVLLRAACCYKRKKKRRYVFEGELFMFGAIFIFSCVSDRPGKGLILTERSFDICCVFVAFLATGKVDFSWPAIYDFHVVSHCPVSFFNRKIWPIVVPAASKI